jgi:hypothetical protein
MPMQDRRAAERIRIDLNVRWESLLGEGRGTVCDLSALGCFVLTRADVRQGELIRIEINFPSKVASFWGEVVYAPAEIGFALRFAFGGKEDRSLLEELMKSVK